jgi:hypothetical protein
MSPERRCRDGDAGPSRDRPPCAITSALAAISPIAVGAKPAFIAMRQRAGEGVRETATPRKQRTQLGPHIATVAAMVPAPRAKMSQRDGHAVSIAFEVARFCSTSVIHFGVAVTWPVWEAVDAPRRPDPAPQSGKEFAPAQPVS